ncbi:hypothetical protein [Ulvibacterium marinum]|uniref:Phage holin family protein n=1 Tax=Ulvibacterium marinum TaxID=2419782 RepID=A0A3B0C248_9FLAO|nr:hypothetical protein [Ulvibacterium marinum]RKN80405.1 hypothetical protein D7Z94_18335 [Ulvibacterium marinum]
MAFEELKRDLTETDADVRSYLENSEEYLKLKVFKVLMGMITSGAQIILVGAIALLALLILSLAASFVIGEALDSSYYGFVIVGTAYVFIAIICYLLRDRLNGPILRKFSKHYFD